VIANDSSTVTDSNFQHIADLLGASPGLLIQESSHLNMLENLADITVALQRPFGNPVQEMRFYLDSIGRRVRTNDEVMPDDLGIVTTASTSAPISHLTTSQPTVLLTTNGMLALTSLAIDPGITLELAPDTTITLDGPLTNQGTIVVPATSTFTLGSNAVVSPGDAGTLTDNVPALVGSLQITSPWPSVDSWRRRQHSPTARSTRTTPFVAVVIRTNLHCN
jgi:hypothetical protein